MSNEREILDPTPQCGDDGIGLDPVIVIVRSSLDPIAYLSRIPTSFFRWGRSVSRLYPQTFVRGMKNDPRRSEWPRDCAVGRGEWGARQKVNAHRDLALWMQVCLTVCLSCDVSGRDVVEEVLVLVPALSLSVDFMAPAVAAVAVTCYHACLRSLTERASMGPPSDAR